MKRGWENFFPFQELFFSSKFGQWLDFFLSGLFYFWQNEVINFFEAKGTPLK